VLSSQPVRLVREPAQSRATGYLGLDASRPNPMRQSARVGERASRLTRADRRAE